jgi:hypothetical protein
MGILNKWTSFAYQSESCTSFSVFIAEGRVVASPHISARLTDYTLWLEISTCYHELQCWDKGDKLELCGYTKFAEYINDYNLTNLWYAVKIINNKVTRAALISYQHRM